MKKYKKPFITKYGEVMAEICDLNDILVGRSTHSVLNNGFRKYKPLFKGVIKRFHNRWDSQWYNKDSNEIMEKSMRRITVTFFDKMLKDLIYNNYEFCFPDDVCRLSIGYKTWTDPVNKTKFKYNMKTGGLTYTPRIVFANSVFRKMQKLRYYFMLAPKYQKMMMKEIIDNNHEYTNSEHYDNCK